MNNVPLTSILGVFSNGGSSGKSQLGVDCKVSAFCTEVGIYRLKWEMWIAAGALVSVVRSESREDVYCSRIQAPTVFLVVGMTLGMAV